MIKFPLLKLSKSIIFNVFGREEASLMTENLVKLSCTSLARRKHLHVTAHVNGFRRQKSFTMKASAEFYCRQIAEKFSLKFPLCITNLEGLIQTTLLFFGGPSPSAECLYSTS